MADDVQLPDLEVISRFSLAVRAATAPREEVVAALESDLAWLTGGARRRRPPAETVVEPPPAPARPARTRAARTRAAAPDAEPAPAPARPARRATRRPARRPDEA